MKFSSFVILVLALIAVAAAGWLQFYFPILQYLVICRYPLVAGLLLLFLPVICGCWIPRLLRSLLVVRLPGVFFVCFVATLVSQAVGSTLVAFLLRSPERFQLDRPPQQLIKFIENGIHYNTPWLVVALLIPLAITVCIYAPLKRNGQRSWLSYLALLFPLRLVFAVGGVLAGLGIVMLQEPLQCLIETTITDKYLVDVPADWSQLLGRGYFSISGGESFEGKIIKPGEMYPAHIVATALFLANLLVYALGGWLLYPLGKGLLRRFFQKQFPALAYLLLLMLIAIFFLAGASYFLDYFYLPPLLLMFAVSAFFFLLLRLDHYFTLLLRDMEGVSKENPTLTADEGIQRWIQAERQRLGELGLDRKPTLVVVAANGGGILAAAWAARVLSGLCTERRHFAPSLRLISSVSGGSVGTVFFMDRFPAGDGPMDDATRQSLVDCADASSLEATAWGIAYPDLLRAIFAPLAKLFRHVDRGWAIERSWQRHLTSDYKTLDAWRPGLIDGTLPAVILNSTVVETGERFLLSPLSTNAPPNRPRAKHFFDLYPEADVSLVTAARLSATFPYLSPIARADADPGQPALHFADGGYFDNFGVVTAIEWLESVLPKYHDQLEKVKFIHIRSGADTDQDDSKTSGRGWLYSVLGPLFTLLQTRTRTQTERNERELQLVVDRWKQNGLTIDEVAFDYSDDLAPLSWELKQYDREKLNRAWDGYVNNELPGLDDLA